MKKSLMVVLVLSILFISVIATHGGPHIDDIFLAIDHIVEGTFDSASDVDCNDVVNIDDAMILIQAVIDETTPQCESQTGWNQIGLEGVGVVSSVSVSRTNNQHIVFGTEYAGAFQSLDGGVTWNKIQGLPAQEVSRVLVDPSNDNILYALVGGSNLFKSENQGSSWNSILLLNTFPNMYNYDNTDLFTWSSGKIFLRVGPDIRVSHDGGDTWQTPNTLPTDLVAFYRFIKIKQHGKGLLAIKMLDSTSVLYKTIDGGLTWNEIFNTGSQYPNHEIKGYDLTDDGAKIIFALWQPNVRTIIAKSTDGGNRWQMNQVQNSNFRFRSPQEILLEDESFQNFKIFVHGNSLFSTSNFGNSFEKLFEHDPNTPNTAGTNYDVVDYIIAQDDTQGRIPPHDIRYGHILQIGNIGPFEYWIPDDVGLFKYDTSSNTLTNMIQNINIAPTFKVSSTSCGRIYSGLWHQGALMIDEHNQVKMLTPGQEQAGYGIGIDRGCTTPILSSNGYYHDDGRNWDEPSSNVFWSHNLHLKSGGKRDTLPKYHNGKWYIMAKERGTTGEFSVFSLSEDLTTKTEEFSASLDTINTYYFEGNQLLVSGRLGLWKKVSGNWQLNNWQLPYDFNQVIYGEVFAVSGQNILVGTKSGLYVSNDNGVSWEKKFDYNYIEDIILIPRCNKIYASLHPAFTRDNPAEVFQNIRYGVWESADFGQTWNQLGNELNEVTTSGLYYDQWRNKLLAATLGEGIWVYDLSGSC